MIHSGKLIKKWKFQESTLFKTFNMFIIPNFMKIFTKTHKYFAEKQLIYSTLVWGPLCNGNELQSTTLRSMLNVPKNFSGAVRWSFREESAGGSAMKSRYVTILKRASNISCSSTWRCYIRSKYFKKIWHINIPFLENSNKGTFICVFKKHTNTSNRFLLNIMQSRG